jgi:hypothetical protein
LSWVCPPEKLDYGYYLPMFLDGLKITEYPLAFIARQGVEDMLYAAREQADRIVSLAGSFRWCLASSRRFATRWSRTTKRC